MNDADLLEAIQKSTEGNYFRGCLLICMCEGSVFKSTSQVENIPPGAIGHYKPSSGKHQWCAHETCVRYDYVIFDRQGIREELYKYMEKHNMSAAMYNSLKVCQDYLQSGTDSHGNGPLVRLVNAMGSTKSTDPKPQHKKSKTNDDSSDKHYGSSSPHQKPPSRWVPWPLSLFVASWPRGLGNQ